MYLALQEVARQWSSREIHDTVAAIARQPMFGLARQSLVGRFFRYLYERLSEFLALLRGSPNARLLVIAGLLGVLLIVVARIVVGRRVDARQAQRRGTRRGVMGRVDAWSAAEALAAAHDYTGACHALYAAVVDALSRDGMLRRHSSKTSGDYSRELRPRGVPVVHEFRSFAGDFDRVIYGSGVATEDDYARLAQAAERAVHSATAA